MIKEIFENLAQFRLRRAPKELARQLGKEEPLRAELFSVAQMLAGTASAGRWTGVQSAIGNLAGITGPVITGLIVDNFGYGPTFTLTAAIIIAGVTAFAFGVPKVTQVDWSRAKAQRAS